MFLCYAMLILMSLKAVVSCSLRCWLIDCYSVQCRLRQTSIKPHYVYVGVHIYVCLHMQTQKEKKKKHISLSLVPYAWLNRAR